MLLENARTQISAVCRRLTGDDLVVGTAGNVSTREGDLVAITPVSYTHLTLPTTPYV